MEANRTERAAFEALVVRNQDVVCAVPYAVLRDLGRSEEVAQEAFLVARQRMPAAEVTPAWLCGVARNLARNAARRRTEVPMSPTSSDLGSRAELDPAPDARAELIRRETADQAAAALAELPETYRDAVVLYYRGDGSMAAVAAALDISLDTAQQRVHRGRERLRDLLAPVEATLRATRPGTAFTAAAVGLWLIQTATAAAATAHVGAGSSGAAQAGAGSGAAHVGAGSSGAVQAGAGSGAAHVGAGSSGAVQAGRAAGGTRWRLLLAAGAVTIPAAVLLAVRLGSEAAAPAAARGADLAAGRPVTSARAAGGAAVGPAAWRIPARFPSGQPRRPLPRGAIAVSAPEAGPPPSSPTVDLDFTAAPFDAMMRLLGDVLDAPIMVDPPIDTRVHIRAKDRPALEVLDLGPVGDWKSGALTEIGSLALA